MIDIKKKDGTVKLSVEFSDSSLYRKELMVEEYVMLNFSTDTIVRFSKGDYIETEFGKFDVVTINRPKENSTTGGYDYGQRFDGFVEKLKTRMFFYDRQNNKECTWKLTHTPSAFLDIVCSNIKALGWGEYAYSIDASLTEMKNVNFDSTSIFDALTAIAEAWGIEWWIDDDLTIHLSKCEHGDPVILSLDNEVVDMDRSEGSSSYATRLYAFGSTRNIPTNYRGASAGTVVQGVVEKRLKLPAGIDYVDAWPNMADEDVVEAVVNFDEIYPKRIGTISEITTKQYTESVENTDGNSTVETWNAYRFKDGGISFSKDYLIPGRELRIVFQTGVLAGMDFAISFEPNTDGGSGTGSQIYELVRNDDYGINLPNDTLKPHVGDSYVLYGFDIALVSSTYVPAAEHEVLAAARLHLQKVCVENAIFTCNTNPIKCAGYVENTRGELVYAAANIIDLGVGQKVTLINDNQFANEGFGSRIFAIEKLLCDKFSCKYSIGGTAKYSRLSDIEGKVAGANDSADENKEEIRSSKKKLIDFTNRKFRDVQETTKLLEKSLLNFSGSINPISVKAMQLLVGDESLQFRFVNSKTAPQPIAHSVSFNHSTKRLFAVTGILQHLTIGIKTISSSHAASEYRYWNITDFTSPYIADGTKPFYLYAEVDKVEETGVFVLSEVPIGMDEISGKYYLLVGILNSEFDGERSFVTLYGYSEILPGRITTEKIVSPSGNTYFDFVNEVIQGKITFKSGSAGLYNLVEWKDEDARITTAQTSASEAKKGVVSAKDAIASNLGYEDYTDFYNKAVLEGNTILEGGRLRNNMVDTDALFAKELVAKNMIVLGGKVGDFDIASKLIGSGYTNGVLNGNQIILDPSNNEVVLAKNGVKRVRLTNNALTPLAELKSDGGTIYCANSSAAPIKKSSTLALLASRNTIGVGGDGLSRTNAVGIVSKTPMVYNTIDEGGKVTLKPAFYSLDLPYVVNIVHSGDQTDGRYNRITGKNTCKVQISLVSTNGVVSSYSDAFEMAVDTVDSGSSIAYNRMARFNFSVSSAEKYWLVTTFTIVGSNNPIKYQSYNHATTFRHSWWSTNNNWDVQYELSVASGMSIDGSIGMTELSNSGFQSVWTDHRFIRIDGNVTNSTFIQSEGVWMHNGVEVKFDTATITGYIDPTKFASKNYVDDGFYTKSAADGCFIAKSSTNLQVINSPVQFIGQVQITGDIIQNGNAYKIYPQDVLTKNDFITLRDGALSYLPDGSYTGFKSKMVFSDGSDGYLVFGSDGMARVGKQANLQMLATREDNPIDGAIQYYSAASKRLTCGVLVENLWHRGNLNRGDVNFSANNINVSNSVFVGGKNKAQIIGSWNSSYYWGIGNVDDLTDTILLKKCNDNGEFTEEALNVYVTGEGNFAGNLTANEGSQVYDSSNSNNSRTDWRAKDFISCRNILSNSYSGTGLTASGWIIDNAGNANVKSLTVRELARFYELEIDKIRCINGGLAITPANGIITAIAGSVLYFDEVPQFVVGDIVRAQKWTNGVRGFKAPITAIDPVAKSITLGTFITGDLSQIKIGDEIIVWNSLVGGRDGLIYMSANDAGSPFIDVVKNEVIKCRMGNIGGMNYNGTVIPANTMGYFADGDVYIKNGHFTGEVNITGGNAATKNYVQESVGTIKEFAIPNLGNSLKMYDNEYFSDGVYLSGPYNHIAIYNNGRPGQIFLDRVNKDIDTPSSSNKMLFLEITGEQQAPGLGGFTFSSPTEANNVYICRFVAKFDVNGTVEWASNSIGVGGTGKWLTSNKGTGKYEEYIYKVCAGQSGEFGSTNYFYFNTNGEPPTQDLPFSVCIASGTVYNITKDEIIEKSKLGCTLIQGGYIKTELLDVNTIFAKQATIGGWNIASDSIDSTNGKIRINNAVASVFVAKPTGGHVMLGQTFINGTWTGQYGISATDSNSRTLFRLDDSGNSIADWNFTNNQFYNGTNGAGPKPMIRLSTANIGSGYVYSADRILEGLSLTWHQSNNAGHIVFGQIASSGNSIKDNFKGIQMMSWDGQEYFCLSANAGLSGSKEVYNRIAGWEFDSSKFTAKGTDSTTVLNAATGNLLFTGTGAFTDMNSGVGRFKTTTRGFETYSTAYFKNNTKGDYANVGIYVECQNGNLNSAIEAKGQIVTNRNCIGYGVVYEELQGRTIPLSILNGTQFIIKQLPDSVSRTVHIPTQSDIEACLNIKEGENYRVVISIEAKWDSLGFYVAIGSRSWGDCFRGFQGQSVGTSFFKAGNRWEIALCRIGSEYFAQVITESH